MNLQDNNKLIAEFMGRKHLSKEDWSFMKNNYSGGYGLGKYKEGWFEWREKDSEAFPNGIGHKHVATFKYHTSWDWLMPVVEKIESININQYKSLLGFADIDGEIDGHFWFRRLNTSTEIFISVYYWQVDRQISGLTKEFEGKTPIESLYVAVAQFIQWYNLQKQQS